MAQSLETRVERLETTAQPSRRRCFVGVMPGEDAEQKITAYVEEHGEQPVGVTRVHFVAPLPLDEHGNRCKAPQEKRDGVTP